MPSLRLLHLFSVSAATILQKSSKVCDRVTGFRSLSTIHEIPQRYHFQEFFLRKMPSQSIRNCLWKLESTFMRMNTLFNSVDRREARSSFSLTISKTTTRSLCVGSVKMGTANHAAVSYQSVVVMRHGERFDNLEPSWAATAARPWDPPLAEPGRKRALETGRRLRASLEFPIRRVFVSPFLRCLQTAVVLVSSLATVEEGGSPATDDGVTVDPSKVKVSVEYGLCEMMNSRAIRPNVAPKDGNMRFDIAECEAMLPPEIVDTSVERVYKEFPQWGESALQAEERYKHLIKDLADKYPTDNLLLITHGEGVKVAVSSLRKDAEINQVQYCGYVELRRPIIFKKDHTFTSGDFDLLTPSDKTGVSYSLPPSFHNATTQTFP